MRGEEARQAHPSVRGGAICLQWKWKLYRRQCILTSMFPRCMPSVQLVPPPSLQHLAANLACLVCPASVADVYDKEGQTA